MSLPRPKTKGLRDIRSFFKKEDTVAGCQVRVKDENGGDSVVGHLHSFVVKLSRNDRKEYTISCDQPRTVLEVIKSNDIYQKMNINCPDGNIVIQLGKEDRASIVATHFPCSCIGEGECLIISCQSEKVEEVKGPQKNKLQPRNNYSVFYIDREGGVNTKTKELFRNGAVRRYKFLCVYGEKGMTVKEAVNRDGRFIDDIGAFELSDNENPNVFTGCNERVDKLDQKMFKICLPLNKRENEEGGQEKPGASNRCGTKVILDVAQQRGLSVISVVEMRQRQSNSGVNTEERSVPPQSNTTEEVSELLRQLFPKLKEHMKSRFPGNSYEKTLKLKKEDFGKIQQSFSEVHRVRKLLKLGRSVCKVVVVDVCQGTGFVLFDNFIMTNAHLFKDCVDGKELQEGQTVYAIFNYEEPVPHTKYFCFSAEKRFIDFNKELDYAILELNPQGQTSNNLKNKKITVPPGLLDKFGPVPLSGEACIIGHPGGEVKQMDPTCIIKKERRMEAVNDKIKEDLLVIHQIIQELKAQAFENIMTGGNIATYNTFMYHGSSGSPVFDAQCKVFGLHTSGFTILDGTKHVIEYAGSLLTIFENFVRRLKESGNEQLLKRVEEEAKGNSYLKKTFNVESDESDESMDIDEK